MFVTEMPNGNIHKRGFVPELPGGCDLSGERILLHCCCAPCSTAIIEWMVGEGLRPGIFFSNSNIVPFREYEIRRDELRRYAAAHGLETIDDEYDHAAWLAFVRRLETGVAAVIAECCTHAPLKEDIGRVKIPRMLKKRFGENLQVELVSGTDFPDDLTGYDLIIQCGACMFNRKYVMYRIDRAKKQQVPVTNYGITIAHLTGILDHVALPE